MSAGRAPFSPAWLRGDARAVALLPLHFRDPASRARAMAAASARKIPAVVLEEIRTQNAALPPSSRRDASLRRLAEAGVTVVVTGQQMGLFLGPLFTLYKAAAAVVTARVLEEETGRPCVPLFWLQTEDHDLAEIDNTVIPTGGVEPLTVRLGVRGVSDPSASRAPVGPLVVGDAIGDVLREVRGALAGHPHADAHLALLERTYRPDATLADAFAQLLGELFQETPLVVLDPRRPALAELARPFHRRVLEEAEAVSDALTARASALEAAGFAAQVHLRPGSPLSFFSPEGPSGPRYRLDPIHEGAEPAFVAAGRPDVQLGLGELLAHLDREPLRFTTSALLRPLLQDSWLPTAAYVGGPAELSYFAQLPPLYDRWGISMPLVVPRARFRVLDDRTRALLEKLPISADEAASPIEEVLALVASRQGTGGFSAPADVERRLLDVVRAPLQAFAVEAAALDPSLAKTAELAERAIVEAVERLTSKYGKVLARRDEVSVERARRLAALVAPSGLPQERVFGVSYYAARFGGPAFVQLVLDHLIPFSGDLVDLAP